MEFPFFNQSTEVQNKLKLINRLNVSNFFGFGRLMGFNQKMLKSSSINEAVICHFQYDIFHFHSFLFSLIFFCLYRVAHFISLYQMWERD